MNYFAGSSLPEWINDLKVSELYQPEVGNNRLCCVYDFLYCRQSSSPNIECLILILTDGKYFIPALVHADLARDQFHLPVDFKDSLSSIKGKVILISKSAFGAFRWSGGFFPYIIAFNWIMLSVYESAIDPNITPIYNNAIVKESIERLKASLEEKSLGGKSVSTVYKTTLVERKFMDFFPVEACLEFFICHYLNIGTVYGDTNANEGLQVQSVDISNKRPIEESNNSQLKKKRKPSTVAIAEDDVIEPLSSNEPIEPLSNNEPVEPPSSSEPTPSITRYRLDEFLTPKEYQSQVIDTLWSSEFEIPDSAIIPKSTSILNNPPPIEEIVEEITNEIPNSLFDNSTPVNPPPELTQSTQLSSDYEEEEMSDVTVDPTYAAAEAMILDQINKVGATTFERRTAFANLRNIRLQRDTLEFVSSR